MRIKHCFTMIFICMLLVAGTMTSGAESLRFPLILDGNIHLNGEPAPIGTEIVAKLNGDIVGQTTTTLEGIYGNIPQNKLFIDCSPEDYKNIEFYVNGIEAQLANMDLIGNAHPGEIIEFNISIIFVDDNSDAGYTLIQSAVNNASDGNTIVIYPGTYTENVNVNKELIIISKSGNPADTIVQAADSVNHVFYVTANNVTINGFMVTNGTLSKAILIHGVTGCSIENNNVTSNKYGIYLNNSDNNKLINNSVYSNDYIGICLFESNNNSVNSNSIKNNLIGVDIIKSCNNLFSENTANDNEVYAFYFHTLSKNNYIVDNEIQNNFHFEPFGTNNVETFDFAESELFFFEEKSECNEFICEIVEADSSQNGSYANLNEISISALDNIVGTDMIETSGAGILSGIGIYMWYDNTDNKIISNIIENNWCGINLGNSSSNNNNTIYNNYLNNDPNIEIFGNGRNIWNITKTSDTNIVDGYFLGGNYWAIPDGTGFSQTCTDSDGDGICDSPYNINGINIDYLPLSMPFNPLVYDANSNGMIEKSEVIESIKDYFSDKISKDNVIEVIVEYFNT